MTDPIQQIIKHATSVAVKGDLKWEVTLLDGSAYKGEIEHLGNGAYFIDAPFRFYFLSSSVLSLKPV
jgi:hypothetical protein